MTFHTYDLILHQLEINFNFSGVLVSRGGKGSFYGKCSSQLHHVLYYLRLSGTCQHPSKTGASQHSRMTLN